VSLSKSAYIFGYSGHSYVVIDTLFNLGYNVVGYFDKFEVKENIFNLQYLGDETLVDLAKIVGSNLVFPAVGDNSIRKKIVKLIKQHDLNETVIIDENASVSRFAEVGHSSFISSGAVLNSWSKIGVGCIINTGSIIEHECILGDFVHIAPGAVLTGNVKVGDNTFIGANAVINPGITIGEDVIIGSGTVVLKDIPSKTKWVGNPARQF
jgi:sugar O-acyltransferase (sialic acid O-acetyltransferase NeuD family)